MQSIERFAGYEASSPVDYYFLPFLHQKEFRESFITEQALLSRNTMADSNYLAGIYLADNGMASVWHHNMLMVSRSQTIYGLATKSHDGEYSLDWETKGPAILGIVGGLDH